MNSYQFIHIESFALTPKKNSKRRSAESVLRECAREIDSS